MNSLILTALILNQNEVKQNSINQKTSSSSNPLEKFTWIAIFVELILLLIRGKISES
jgi:hypothetical protein